MTDRQSTHTEDAIAKQEHVAELDAIVRGSTEARKRIPENPRYGGGFLFGDLFACVHNSAT